MTWHGPLISFSVTHVGSLFLPCSCRLQLAAGTFGMLAQVKMGGSLPHPPVAGQTRFVAGCGIRCRFVLLCSLPFIRVICPFLFIPPSLSLPILRSLFSTLCISCFSPHVEICHFPSSKVQISHLLLARHHIKSSPSCVTSFLPTASTILPVRATAPTPAGRLLTSPTTSRRGLPVYHFHHFCTLACFSHFH